MHFEALEKKHPGRRDASTHVYIYGMSDCCGFWMDLLSILLCGTVQRQEALVYISLEGHWIKIA